MRAILFLLAFTVSVCAQTNTNRVSVPPLEPGVVKIVRNLDARIATLEKQAGELSSRATRLNTMAGDYNASGNESAGRQAAAASQQARQAADLYNRQARGLIAERERIILQAETAGFKFPPALKNRKPAR